MKTILIILTLILPAALTAREPAPVQTTTYRHPITMEKTWIETTRTWKGGDQSRIIRDSRTGKKRLYIQTRTYRSGAQSLRMRDPVTKEIISTSTRD